MATPILYDSVMETVSSHTGTGTYTLAGAVAGFRGWSTIGNGLTSFYYAESVDGAAAPNGGWEVGLGTYTLSGTTLARTTILSSSNANAAVSWSSANLRVGNTIPASVMNQLYNPPSCYAARTASQSITHATITSIAFNATDVWDTAALHDPSVIPERITIPTGGDGVYLFTGTVTWTADVNGSVRIQYISKNGTPLIGSVVPLVTGSGICATQVALQVKVAAGDYVEFQVFQDAGHSLNVDSAQFQATRIAIG